MNLPFARLRPPRSAAPSASVGALGAATVALFVALASPAQVRAQTPANGSPASVLAQFSALSADEQKDLPNGTLTSEIMFGVLASEIALQRGEPQPAFQTYISLARETRDPRMAQRAAEIALGAQSPVDALTAARLWHQYAPDSRRAQQLDATLLVLNGNLGEAQPLLATELATVPAEDRGAAILRLQLLISRGPDRIGGLHLLEALLKDDLKRPETQLALARQQLVAGDRTAARKSLEAALRAKPDFEPAALLLGQFGSDERKEAILSLQNFVAKNPDSRNARVVLSQLYLADNQLDAAEREFKAMRAQDPSDLAPLLALALIDIDQKRYDDAKKYLRQYAQAAEKRTSDPNADAGQAYLYLAQISLEQKDDAGALKWLDKVGASSPQHTLAQVTRAQVLAEQGKLDDARRLLASLEASDSSDEALIARTDASILIAAKRYDEAEQRLAEASRRFPNAPDLLYDYSMAAERNHHFVLMESLLRRLMTLQPDNPEAYNALGYSLADRNERLDEADKLIEKASALAPNDAYIMDSLGWVKYRLGDKQEAATLLKRAFSLQPNAEIGAHLGEVLWSLGQQDEAKATWREARKLEPDNDTLLQTLKRFQVGDL